MGRQYVCKMCARPSLSVTLKRTLAAVVCVAVLASCTAPDAKSKQPAAEAERGSLPLPPIPAELIGTRERVVYAVEHFWDAMDWQDTSLTRNEAFMEQTMANYFAVIAAADTLTSAESMNRMIASASISPGLLSRIVDLCGLYLYEPDSPMYNPEGYAVLLDQLMLDPTGSGLPLETIRYLHDQIMKNRKGHIAADFSFVDRHGEKRTLHSGAKRNAQTLLLFYDPECNLCENLEKSIASSPKINNLISEGGLRVVAIDAFGTEYAKWKVHADSLPKNWIVGYSPDGKLDEEEIYVIRATPSLYLLDGSNRVVIKDANADEIEQILS